MNMIIKLVVGSALLGLVASQASEITTNADGMRVVRRNIETSVTDIDVRLERAVGDAKNQAQAAAYNATLMATMALTDSMNAMQANVASQIADMAAALTAATAATDARLADISDTIDTTVTTQMNTMGARLDALSTATASDASALSTAVGASVTQALARSATQTTASLNTLNTSLRTLVGNKASAFKHVWLGGCASSNNGCWQDFCLSRVELDKAAPYFRKASNTRMKALVAGMYRMNAYFMGTRNYMHVSVFINGQRRRNTYNHVYHGWWKSDYSDHTFYIPAGQDFWFQGCGHFHSAGSDYGHQRQEFEYIGKRPA